MSKQRLGLVLLGMTAAVLWLSSLFAIQKAEIIGYFDATVISSENSILKSTGGDIAAFLSYEEPITLSTCSGRSDNVLLKLVDPVACKSMKWVHGRGFFDTDNPETGIVISEDTAVLLWGRKDVAGLCVECKGNMIPVLGVFAETEMPWETLAHYMNHSAMLLRETNSIVNRITIISDNSEVLQKFENELAANGLILSIARIGEEKRIIQQIIRFFVIVSVFLLTKRMRGKNQMLLIRVIGWAILGGSMIAFICMLSVPVRFIPDSLLPSAIIQSFYKWVLEQNLNPVIKTQETMINFWYSCLLIPLCILQIFLSGKASIKND